jgi:hypothetical protein
MSALFCTVKLTFVRPALRDRGGATGGVGEGTPPGLGNFERSFLAFWRKLSYIFSHFERKFS